MGTEQVVRVAVIGIGSAGLCQLKQLVDAFDRREVRCRKRLELVGYEGRSDVGGLWNYDPEPPEFVRTHLGPESSDKTLIYPPAGHFSTTAVYEGLVATLPHELMSFRGYQFPPDTPTFPSHDAVTNYLHAYAKHYDLYKYVRFSTLVERLKLSERLGSRRWTLTARGPAGVTQEEYDHVVISNGHYSDPWIPPSMKGLKDWPGGVLHSRQYRRAEDYAGQTVLVVGSFSSGSDITRLLGTMNHKFYIPGGQPKAASLPTGQGFTKIYQSTTGLPNSSFTSDIHESWKPYIELVALIDHFEGATPPNPKGRIVLVDGRVLDSIDTVIFATGYNNALPFCKIDDLPWREHALLDEVISEDERVGGDEWEIGGMRGLRMKGMDEIQLFIKGDRSIALLGLQYQIVPFPFAEAQARLVALLWAGKLPSFPEYLQPPPNSRNTFLNPVPAGANGSGFDSSSIRRSVAQRGEYVFPNPYEWEYTEYIFGLMAEADDDAEEVSSEHWRKVEDWRREQRADVSMRKRVLGY